MKEQFTGASSDDAAAHLNNFVELCEMQKYKDVDCNIIKLKLSDIHFGSREQMNPLLENIFQNVKKIGTKFVHAHPDILCSCTNFRKERTFFVSLIKKTNFCMHI
jgi:hypothetical protein